MKKYYFLLAVTVLIIALLAGEAVWLPIYLEFFYVPPPGPVLPESAGPNLSSGLYLLTAALAGFIGGVLIHTLDYDGSQKDHPGGEAE